jgi:hypothetical protein
MKLSRTKVPELVYCSAESQNILTVLNRITILLGVILLIIVQLLVTPPNDIALSRLNKPIKMNQIKNQKVFEFFIETKNLFLLKRASV